MAVTQGTRVVTSEGLDGALATNLLGFYRLTTGLTPLLKASAPSRVVNVVSAGMFTRVSGGRVAHYRFTSGCRPSPRHRDVKLGG